jgi:23S rRNA maturation mini-RNase III
VLSGVYGESMISKENAIQINSHALKAVSELSLILSNLKEQLSESEYEKIKRGVGVSIGTIQIEICEYINTHFPELDDLK